MNGTGKATEVFPATRGNPPTPEVFYLIYIPYKGNLRNIYWL